MVELGVFLPVLNNGWVISTAAPQYHPSYAMNKAMTLLAEDLGFSFVLSPVKYRGFGGPTAHWDYVLESFEVMAALAEATDRIRLYGSVALPTVPPAASSAAWPIIVASASRSAYSTQWSDLALASASVSARTSV